MGGGLIRPVSADPKVPPSHVRYTVKVEFLAD